MVAYEDLVEQNHRAGGEEEARGESAEEGGVAGQDAGDRDAGAGATPAAAKSEQSSLPHPEVIDIEPDAADADYGGENCPCRLERSRSRRIVFFFFFAVSTFLQVVLLLLAWQLPRQRTEGGGGHALHPLLPDVHQRQGVLPRRKDPAARPGGVPARRKEPVHGDQEQAEKEAGAFDSGGDGGGGGLHDGDGDDDGGKGGHVGGHAAGFTVQQESLPVTKL